MKRRQMVIAFITKVIFFGFTFHVFSVNSAKIRDPLQPIWDSINQLSRNILEDLQIQLDISAEEFTDAMDNRIGMQDPEEEKPSAPSPEEAAEKAKIKEAATSTLSETFPQFYNTHIKQKNEGNISSIFQSLKISLSEMEVKVIRHLDQTLGKGDIIFHLSETLEQDLAQVRQDAASLTDIASGVDEKVTKIREEMPKTDDDTCSARNSELRQFIDDSIPSRQRLDAFEREWHSTYQAIIDNPEAKSYNRDCSDILWINPNATSGVYSIFPSRNIKREVRVWCDMTTADNDGSVGGWTVVLRRRNTTAGLLNFTRTWEEYSAGFGEAGEEGEWWLGLDWMHQLTYHQPYQVNFLMHDIERGYFLAHYSTFRIEDEARNYRLIVDGFSGNVSDAFKYMHHGMQFSTMDRDNDQCESCECAVNNLGGWWFNKCHRTSLTNPFPTSNDREVKTIRWLSGIWLILDDVTMMIRPTDIRSRVVSGPA